MRVRSCSLACIAALLISAPLFSAPASAHHSRAMYQPAENAITIVGKVTELLWANPHVYLYVDVVNEDGRAENWALEAGSPHQLTEQGLPRDKLQADDEITILVRRLKGGGRGGLFREIIFADGSEFIYESATVDRP
jgi:hypothetical protein